MQVVQQLGQQRVAVVDVELLPQVPQLEPLGQQLVRVQEVQVVTQVGELPELQQLSV